MTVFSRYEYWAWAHGNLLTNSERGFVAEYLVGNAIGSLGDYRVEWDAWDLSTEKGLKVEVKASGYVQSWEQKRPSTLRFKIDQSSGWDAAKNMYSDEKKRRADIYVFCIHSEKDKKRADPLQTDQWQFIVLPTTLLDKKLGSQKTVGISTLLKIGGVLVDYSHLSDAIRDIFD